MARNTSSTGSPAPGSKPPWPRLGSGPERPAIPEATAACARPGRTPTHPARAPGFRGDRHPQARLPLP
eukprot:2960199-Alexandrium_andersonii.AAC.1